MTRQHVSTHGFTLVELVTVMMIAALLGMLGVPAMGKLLAHVETRQIEAKVARTLRHARTAAVMHGARVLVCPSRDGRRCRSGDDWQQGWIVAEDADRDGQPDAGKPALAVVTAMPAGTRIITSAGRSHIVFHPNGNAAGSNARFTICHARQAKGKSVVLANSGRVRVGAPDPVRLQQCRAGIDALQ